MVKEKEKLDKLIEYYENKQDFTWGIILGLIFGLLGNLIILLLDKIYLQFLSGKTLIIIYTTASLFLLILILIISYIFYKSKKNLEEIYDFKCKSIINQKRVK